MIRGYEKNQNKTQIGKLFGISDIKRKNDVNEAQAKSGMNLDKAYKKRSYVMEEMERLLTNYIHDCNQKGLPTFIITKTSLPSFSIHEWE